MAGNLAGKTIILGVTGGIAAYKSAEICSSLVKSGADVHVVMTEHALKFVGAVTFRALTGNQVITSLWDEPQKYDIAHVSLPDKADCLLIAPATANIIGKIDGGIADDMLSTMVMATKAPVILAPAMNCKMWENSVVQENVQKLESLGYKFVMPEVGRLACGVEGAGRLAEPSHIVQRVIDEIGKPQDLKGISILITAGPTQEPIDPVRFIANRSSGKMGYAIADSAAERGAKVILVSGPTSLPNPPGVRVVKVRTAEEMLSAVMENISDVQAVIGAAAVADYKPKFPKDAKIKKKESEEALELVPTKDIMAEVAKQKNFALVGFAAETDNMIKNAQEKLSRKNFDLIIANDVSKPGIGFGADENEVTIISKEGEIEKLPRMSKKELGSRILDQVKKALEKQMEE